VPTIHGANVHSSLSSLHRTPSRRPRADENPHRPASFALAVLLGSALLATGGGCDPATGELAIGGGWVSEGRPLVLEATSRTPATPSSGLPATFEVEPLDPVSRQHVDLPLPRVIEAVALEGGRAVAAVAVDGTLLLRAVGGRSAIVDREVVPGLARDPTGDRLAWALSPPAGGKLRVLNLRTGRRSTLPTVGGAACMPVFSPDGRRLAFVDASPEGISSLWVVGTEGGEPRQLTNVGLGSGGAQARGGPPAGFVPPPDSQRDLAFGRRGIELRAGGRSFLVDPEAGGAR
jgi:hypothetical protein